MVRVTKKAAPRDKWSESGVRARSGPLARFPFRALADCEPKERVQRKARAELSDERDGGDRTYILDISMESDKITERSHANLRSLVDRMKLEMSRCTSLDELSGFSCVAIASHQFSARCICRGAYCRLSIRQFSSTKNTKQGRHLTALLPTHPQHLLHARTTAFPPAFLGLCMARRHHCISRAAANALAVFLNPVCPRKAS
ncbi:hypothetical protein QBC40DRAFT_98454 [Triangularia verruculosa]|uniref:Uncharacterized protein n=1 Tax=Triangularia verruculosa TaxID=2587418 RepID=A0AAN6XQ47_9PEZI|nr:hypothetical protein QBC40DRAFT_98454 [Triangularia verruculosa]